MAALPSQTAICTRAIERIDYHLAFSVGNERNPGIVSTKHWDDLAQQCGLRARFLQGQVQDVAVSLLEHLPPTREKFETLYGKYPALQRIEKVVNKQCRRTISE